MRRASIQAGVFGGALAVLLGLISLLPYVGLCISVPLYPLGYFVTGLVTVRIFEGTPGVGESATGGAVAGLIAAIIGGLAAMFLAPIRLRLAGGPEEVVQLLSPRVVQALIEDGLDPVAVTDFMAGVGAGMACCAAQITTGVLLAASAAALYAAYRRT